jgi:hypothetical protein
MMLRDFIAEWSDKVSLFGKTPADQYLAQKGSQCAVVAIDATN